MSCYISIKAPSVKKVPEYPIISLSNPKKLINKFHLKYSLWQRKPNSSENLLINEDKPLKERKKGEFRKQLRIEESIKNHIIIYTSHCDESQICMYISLQRVRQIKE